MGVSYATGTGTLVRTGEERLTLIRRTYSLVLAGLLVTMAGAAVAFTQPQIMALSAAHPFVIFFVSLAPLFMAQRMARTFPANVGFLFLFTFLEGIFLAYPLALAERMQPGIVGNAALLSGTAFGALTVYAFASRRDFSAWGGFFIVGLLVVLLAGLLNAFVMHSAGIGLWLAGATVLVFSGLLVFDTWRIRNVYGPDDYIPAAISIYLDFINLFLAILRILLGQRRN
jgi:FtsH-binding integral membrane protein